MCERTIATLLCSLLLSAGSAQAYGLNINRGFANSLGRAYGYCSGQALTAARIIHEHPDLAAAMARSLILFEAGTRDVCRATEDLLRDALGEQFETWRAEVLGGLDPIIEGQALSRDVAVGFVAEVERRAGWEIESPVRETLLSVRYREMPETEIADGHFQRFTSLGHPKSMGIEAEMKMPLSWKASEGERPHILQKWVIQNGFGLTTIHLDIRDTMGVVVTEGDVAEIARDSDPAELAPEGAVLRKASAFSHETLPGLRLEYDMIMERAGEEFLMRIATHQVFLRDRAIGIMCTTSGDPTAPERVAAEFEELAPVCWQALNGLVLPQIYR